MFRPILFLILALFVVSFTRNGQAQDLPGSGGSTTAASSVPADCPFPFVSGAGRTYLEYCVTTDGTISGLQTPEGVIWQLIGPNFGKGRWEGYGLCLESPATAYWDYGGSGESGNWLPSVVLSHNATTIKIARTTGDGIWTLTQTFAKDAKTSGLKITMALKNNTPATHVAYLVRHLVTTASFPIPTANRQKYVSATSDSAFFWLNTSRTETGWGLKLENVTTKFDFANAYARMDPNGEPASPWPNPCDFAGVEADDIRYSSSVPGNLNLAYAGPVGGKKTITSTMIYHAF
jgi:hypothetical protein